MAAMPDLEVKVTPIFDLSAVSDEVLDRLADLLWEQISYRMLHSSVKVLRLAPDDVIVLSTERNLSMEQGHDIRERAQAIFGPANRVIVLANGVAVGVMRPENYDDPLRSHP